MRTEILRRYGGDDFAQEFSEPPEDEAQVVVDGAHDGVDLVAEATFEEVAAQMAVGLAMADHHFDGGSPPQFASDLAVGPSQFMCLTWKYLKHGRHRKRKGWRKSRASAY